MDTVLLTGATGFLGSHLLRGLLNKTDCNIVILKRSFSNIDRIVEFTDVKRIKSYDIDCVDLETVFTENDIGNAFWNTIGWTERLDVNYYDFILNEENITAFNEQ